MQKVSFLGTATVGERGQVAIPAEARRALGIEPGSKLLFFTSPKQMGLMAVKAEDLGRIVEHLASKAQSIEQLMSKIREADELSAQPTAEASEEDRVRGPGKED